MGILSSMRDLAGGRVGTTGIDDRPAAPGAPGPATGSDAGIAHGQAPSRAIRAAAVRDRQVDELIGLVKGVLADGHVAEGEARFLLDWLTTNVDARDTWPASALYPRLARALSDDRLDADEASELLALLAQTVGGNAPARGEASMATALPLDDPPPRSRFRRTHLRVHREVLRGHARLVRAAGDATRRRDRQRLEEARLSRDRRDRVPRLDPLDPRAQDREGGRAEEWGRPARDRERAPLAGGARIGDRCAPITRWRAIRDRSAEQRRA